MVRRVNSGRVIGRALFIALVATPVMLAQEACSPSSGRENRVGGPGGGNAGGASGSSGTSGGGLGAIGGTTGINTDGSSGGRTDAPCPTGVEWGCKIDACTGQPKTTVRAKVYDPSGQLPLYNVAVYVPNAEVDPIRTGRSAKPAQRPFRPAGGIGAHQRQRASS